MRALLLGAVARLAVANLTAAVVVFTYANPELLKKAARAKPIHRAGDIEVQALDAAFLDALDAVTDRNTSWTLVHTEATLYLSAAGTDLSAPVTRHALGA